jgi:hypothetical protein
MKLEIIAEEEKKGKRQGKSCKKRQALPQNRSSEPPSRRSQACLHAAVGILRLRRAM